MSEREITAQEEVAQVHMGRPHVVILGAGASRATFPDGDKNVKILPLMKDFSQVLNLQSLFEKFGLKSNANFEDVFSDLYENGDMEKVEIIQKKISNYFKSLQLTNHPTIYDHLVLSLRGKDIIATFNWDPLLLDAYVRNKDKVISLPKLAFLHGNVGVGWCEKDKKVGLSFRSCPKCNTHYSPVPLLYPIKKKNYSANLFIQNEWETLKWGLKNAFMITIFGYSGPKSDEEAIGVMKEAWGDKYKRELEQTAFITPLEEEEIHDNWKSFIHTHHCEIDNDFYNSWIANHPRRTGEAWMHQYIEAKFIDNNPIPKDMNFPELWEWYAKFREPEEQFLKNM